MSFAGISFNEQIKSFRLFSSFAPKWASSKPIRKGDFVISKTFLLHEESPLCFAIRTKDGKPVASVGGFIAFQSGQPVIHLTNIQGATKSKRESNPREIHEKLKEALGENWRVFLARQIAQYAGKKGKCVIGSLPPRFYAMGPKGKIALASDKEFLRQIRQYRQTYRKAGLHEHTDGKWRLKPLARRAPK